MNKTGFLNTARPPVFCPGCSHEKVVYALDKALQHLNLKNEQVVIVSDIGCSGLFDTFFNTHAVHGLHGRALTYATGIKMARPDLKVIVTMGDGGLGIGAAHVISTCRRNIDLTLLVLNNFNYGMTGGQSSVTTPADASVTSGFLNQLEKPMDVCHLTGTAGAPWVARTSVYENDLVQKIEEAIKFDGFSVLDIWGICTGRYLKRNRISPKTIKQIMQNLPPYNQYASMNNRPEYSKHYRELASKSATLSEPAELEPIHTPPQKSRQEIVILGSAGQRILTAGEILCIAGATAGLYASQKNDYPITVMRGHSITEVILDSQPIDFTGIENPTIIIAIAEEGIKRKISIFRTLTDQTIILAKKGLSIPNSKAKIIELDFKEKHLKFLDWALASLAWLATHDIALNLNMLESAFKHRFTGKALDHSLEIANIWKT